MSIPPEIVQKFGITLPFVLICHVSVICRTLTGPSTSAAAAAQPAAGLGPAQQFSKDVEDEANSYFQRIYNTSGSSQHSALTIVEQVLEMLKNFKDSPSDRDKVRRLAQVDIELVYVGSIVPCLVEKDCKAVRHSVRTDRCL